MIPSFSRLTGCLPPGVHDATWTEVSEHLGNSPKRKMLLVGLRDACIALRTAGATHLYLDGSFTTDKKNPGDWDACYSQVGIDSKLLDPVFLDFSKNRAAQKAKYKGEAFIAEMNAAALGPPYLEFFQTEKNTGRKKGIVRLDLGTVS
nr:hypothetical protein [uncultured Massilia sp.]